MTLIGCKRKDAVQDQVNDILVVNAFLEINKPIDSVVLRRMNTLNENINLSNVDADVSILHGDEEYILDETSPGVYGLNDPSILVTANSDYMLRIEADGKTIQASTSTPHELAGYTVTKSQINSTQVGDQIDITFDEDSGVDVFYLVKIIPLDEMLQPVVVVNSSNRDEKSAFVYNGDNNIVSILGSYFSYIGNHEIEIYRINEGYLPLFQSTDNPDQFTDGGNILNGYGSFVGTDHISIGIHVE